MAIASVARTTGLSIAAWDPAIVRGVSYTPKGRMVDDDLASKADSYGHVTKAAGGWWSASLSFTGNRPEIEEWYEKGLGRHVEVRNPAGILVWAGFVDSVDIDVGALSATAGPLMEAANRVSVIYTPVLDVAPELTGPQTVTVIANDTDSQDRYGILELVLSGGELLDDGVTDDAAHYRDTYITEHRRPSTDETLAFGARGKAGATLNLKGYVHFLQQYVTEDASEATCSVYTKLTDVLGDDPNGLFSTDYSDVYNNPFLVYRLEDKYRSAWAAINELVNLGDAANGRCVFGMYEGQRFHYKQVGDTPLYQHRLGQPAVQVEDFGRGTPVDPWDVKAGEWVFLPDFLAGLVPDMALPMQVDHRYVLGEEISFQAPNGLKIMGGRYGTLAQWLAKKGLSK